MAFKLDCPCGREIAVAASDAGATVLCACGHSVRVPSLSELRISAGQEAIPLTIVERIRDALAAGDLPIGQNCAVSGRPTRDLMYFHVECERVSTREQGAVGWLTTLFFFLSKHLWAVSDGPIEEHGRQTGVEVPIRIDVEFHERLLAGCSQRRLRDYLRQVPLYAELLEEFPSAVITPAKQAGCSY